MNDESRPEESSLDRYLMNRAPSLLWSTSAARTSIINTRVGFGLIGFGVLLTIIVTAVVGINGLACGIGPAIGGAANLFLGYSWRNRAQQTVGDTQLPGPLWTFIHGLADHVLGPSYAFRASNLGYYPVSNAWNGWRLTSSVSKKALPSGQSGMKSAREILAPSVFELLDEAAKQFNRVHGYLSLPSGAVGTAPREASRIQVAADQAMIDALTIGSAMQQFPENIEGLRPSMQACITALQEAADLVQKLSGPRGQVAPPAEQAVMLRAMLDDLRIETQARTELGQVDQPSLEQLN